MQVVNLKCTACGAPLNEVRPEDSVITCPYCGSTLYVKSSEIKGAEQQEKTEQIRIPLCCTAKNLSDSETLKEILSEMSDVVDENPSSDSILPLIEKILKGKQEAATRDSFPKDYAKVKQILQGRMSDGEELIFYKTAALLGINKMKTGMFVTTERVGYIEGKEIFQVEYRNLETMEIDFSYANTTYWYPNGVEKIFLTALALSNREFGTILAYLVLRTYEESGHQRSVVLRMK